MTVYIDDMYRVPMGRLGRMKMSHMIADTREELMTMARLLGLRSGWLQREGDAAEHFDVSKEKREAAIAAGAVEVTMRQLTIMVSRRRTTGILGTPAEAEPWWIACDEARVARAFGAVQ